MTTRAEAEQALNAAFVTAWTVAGALRTPYAFGNTSLPTATEWTILYIEDFDRVQETFGAAPYRRFSAAHTLVAEIHVQRGENGTRRANELVEVVRTTFESKSISGVHTRATSARHLGTMGRWYKVVVRTPFTYYDQK